MYLNALEFLEEEREAFRPFEALERLTDEQLARPIADAHDWSGRDVMAHVLSGLERSLTVARELAVNEGSPAKLRMDREWDEIGGEVINQRITDEWRALPMSEVRQRFHEMPGELRGYLTVVPEARWVKHTDNLRFFIDETIDHYAEHMPDLEAILDAAS